jgi:UDP-3-O-acyl N-acetylglucosamine deacetylase
MHQATLIKPAHIQGTALFTARPCSCIIHPAPVDHGIVFAINNTRVPVNPLSITSEPVHPAFANIPPRCSAVAADGSTVWLVEHILSALAALRVTNALIELDHHELPIMDGSAQVFVEAINNAGINIQDAQTQNIELSKPIRVEKNGAWIEATPADSTSFEYTIDYGPDSPITQATVRWEGDADEYAQRIAPARTFCLKHEADAMHSAGLFAHLSPSDLLVLDDDGPIDNTLRHEHECALHKLLDLIGDIALLGKPINGLIRAHKSGHALAHDLARAIIGAE